MVSLLFELVANEFSSAGLRLQTRNPRGSFSPGIFNHMLIMLLSN